MNTKDITVLVWDDPKNFNSDETQRSFGNTKNNKVFKEILQFYSLEEFEKVQEKISESDNLVFACHIQVKDLGLYEEFKNSGISEMYNIPIVYYLSSDPENAPEKFKKFGEYEKVLYYHAFIKKIRFDEIKPFKKSELNHTKQSAVQQSELISKHEPTHCDVTILTALVEDEYQSFEENMDGEDKRDCFIGKFKDLEPNDYAKNIALVSQNKMGMVEASIKTSELIRTHNSRMNILAGVCGGRKEKKVKLYDIIIPEQIIDIVTGKYENHEFIPYGYYESMNEDLIKFIKKIVQKPDFTKKEMSNLIPNGDKFKRENQIIQSISIYFDTLACGPFVLKTEKFLDEKSKAISDKIMGFEMESYGFARAFKYLKSKNYGLVIKSVMDYTDDKKDDFVEGDNVKKLAAYMSYICTRALLPHLEKFMEEYI